MQTLFSTKPVSITDGLLIVAIGVLAMAILELEKQKHLMWRMAVLKIYSWGDTLFGGLAQYARMTGLCTSSEDERIGHDLG